jgi:hypothetical protein
MASLPFAEKGGEFAKDGISSSAQNRGRTSVVLEFRKNRDGITYRMANCIAMAEPCWEDRVNELIHPLEGVDVWVDPR